MKTKQKKSDKSFKCNKFLRVKYRYQLIVKLKAIKF